MSLSIGLFQFELSHPNQAPHIGMCLFVEDLRDSGHQVEAALVATDHVEALIERICSREYDLVGLDSIFPIDVVNAIKAARPELRVVVGGVNALSLFIESTADYAVVGPGRQAMRSLAERLAVGDDTDGVENLFRRGPDGIDHTGIRTDWNLDTELHPYRPFVDWDYIGTGRRPGANVHQLSVVPEFGCVYQEAALGRPDFAAIDPSPSPRDLLPHHQLSDRAVEAIEPFIANDRGCSFCVFRFQDLTLIDVERTVVLTMEQISHLAQTTGARQYSLQSENPFRILRPLLEALRTAEIRLEALLIRSLPLVLLAKEREFRLALDLARDDGVTIILQQLGFENFTDHHLGIYNKGISSDDNRRAARLLGDLSREYGSTIDCLSGHGLILFDPWTTIDTLVRNVEVIDGEAPFLARAVGLGARLVFYDPFNPIFRKAQAEGLVRRSTRDFGWDFEFADPDTEDFVQMVRALNRHLAKRLQVSAGDVERNSRGSGPYEAWIFRRALDAYQSAEGRQAELREAFYVIARDVDQLLESGDDPSLLGRSSN